ncbi:MAG: hypothetical protein U0840_10405 [Gemmataceae bacterium]
MRRPWWLLPVLGAVIGAAGSTAAPDELEPNRRLLERWRADADHHARLLRDLRAFHQLPRAQRQQIREFDEALHQGDLTQQTRLWAVLDRYASWRDQLTSEQRRAIDEAPDRATKLARIREIREAQWAARQPAAIRAEIQALPADKREARLAELRDEQRRLGRLWLTGSPTSGEPNLRPSKLTDLPAEVQSYLEGLEPRLTLEEKERLRQAEGKWPEYPRVIRELAELHPVLPPLAHKPILGWTDLPAEVRKMLLGIEKRKMKQLQRSTPNRWPEYALDVTRVLRQEKQSPPPLGASRLSEFPPALQAFVKGQLIPRLSPLQREALQHAEGRWPDYPILLLRLARDRGLVLPGMSLPGPRELWDSVRLPDVPDHLLMQFALHEASAEDRATWELDASDPMGSREKVKRAWYRKKMADQQRRQKGGTTLGEAPGGEGGR